MNCPKCGSELISIFGTQAGENGKPTSKRAYFKCGHEVDIPSVGFWETVLREAVKK